MWPEAAALISKRKDTIAKKRDIVIVIASKNDRKTLESHIAALSKQTFREFNIIIVYGKSDEFLEVENAIHIREKSGRGSAGAFYIGERIALDQGYRTIILADDDCLPVSENLLEEMDRARKKGENAILPQVDYGKAKLDLDIIHHYGCFSREVFEKVGLTYLPFYFGGEDIELLSRIRKKFKVFKISAKAVHKSSMPIILEKENNAYSYVKGALISAILNDDFAGAYSCSLFHLLGAVGYGLVGRRKLARAYISAIWDGTMLRLGKGMASNSTKIKEKPDKIDTKISDVFTSIDYEKLGIIGMPIHWIEKDIRILLNIRKTLGKRVLFNESYGPSFLPIILLSKLSYLKFNGEFFRLSSEQNSIICLLRYLLFHLALFPIAGIALLLVVLGAVIKRIKKIDSMGYGI